MSVTISINDKGNVKQSAAGDLPKNLSQPVVNRYITESVDGQTVINLPFIVDTQSPENFDLIIDGKTLTPGASYDYQFTAIDTSFGSSQVTLNASISGVRNIMAVKRGLKKEVENLTDTRFTQMYAAYGAGFQAFVDESTKLTATTGTPSATQFRSSVVNRASITDLANDLKVRFGPDRIVASQIVAIPTESGPSNEPVYALVGDERGLFRFWGNWTNAVDTGGQQIVAAANATDTFEVTFWGTGFNVLLTGQAGVQDLRASIDGGAEGANFVANGAAVNAATMTRGYNANMISTAANNLTPGLHTIKIRQGSGTNPVHICGFEILNEASTLNIRPGAAYNNFQKYLLSAAQSMAYGSSFESIMKDGSSTGVLGTRGARFITYLKSDGTAAKAAVATNSAAAYQSSTDHTNEELIRSMYWREFGSNLSNDFSRFAAASNTDLIYTCEDGSTILIVNTGYYTGDGAIHTGANGAYLTISFIGTGLDIEEQSDVATTETAGKWTLYVDGVSQGDWYTTTTTSKRTLKVCSGLPYGQHTVKILRGTSVAANRGWHRFMIYGPKKPTLPAGAIELSDQYLVADYSQMSAGGSLAVSQGVIRKGNTREATYVGTWTMLVDTNELTGNYMRANATNSYAEWAFFGTGVDYRFQCDNTFAQNVTISIDGSSNLSGYTTALIYGGTGLTFTAASGTITGTPSVTLYGSTLSIRGMTLGWHRIRVTTNTATNYWVQAIDVITPVHSPKSSYQAEIQNALPIGNSAISDSRKISPVKSESPAKFRGVAVGVTSGPTTTSTSFVPAAEMSLAVPSKGGWFRASYSASGYNSTGGQGFKMAIFTNGTQASKDKVAYSASANVTVEVVDSQLLWLPAGVHQVAVYWLLFSSGTATLQNDFRTLTVEEL